MSEHEEIGMEENDELFNRPIKEEPVKKKKFWHGHEVFECEFCKFDSLNSATLGHHVVVAHTQPASLEPSLIVQTDRFGNEV